MEVNDGCKRERVWLVATSSLWVAGFMGLFGDPCALEAMVVPLSEAMALKGPQIVLIDSGAGSINGRLREVMLQFRRWAPELRPIVISHDAREEEMYIEGLVRAGAKGYLSASATVEEFKVAIDNVKDGSIWAPRKVLSRLVQTATGRGPLPENNHSGSVQFTPREDQVIRMLVGGQCNREIGVNLGIDPGTVKAHLGRIMRKAGVGNRIELTMFALNRERKNPSRRVPLGVVGPNGSQRP